MTGKQFSSFHLCWFLFSEPSGDDKQLDSETGIIAVHYASRYRPFEESFEVLPCGFTIFFQASESHTYFKSYTDSGLLALRWFTPPLTSRLHTGELSLWQAALKPPAGVTKRKKVCVCVCACVCTTPQNRADGRDRTKFDSPSKPWHFQISLHFVLFNLLAHPTPSAI